VPTYSILPKSQESKKSSQLNEIHLAIVLYIDKIIPD